MRTAGLSLTVDNNVDSLHIDTSTKDIRADLRTEKRSIFWRETMTKDWEPYKDTLLERLELLVSPDSLVLGQTRMNGDRGEVALSKQSIQFGGSTDRLDEDADLCGCNAGQNGRSSWRQRERECKRN